MDPPPPTGTAISTSASLHLLPASLHRMDDVVEESQESRPPSTVEESESQESPPPSTVEESESQSPALSQEPRTEKTAEKSEDIDSKSLAASSKPPCSRTDWAARAKAAVLRAKRLKEGNSSTPAAAAAASPAAAASSSTKTSNYSDQQQILFYYDRSQILDQDAPVGIVPGSPPTEVPPAPELGSTVLIPSGDVPATPSVPPERCPELRVEPDTPSLEEKVGALPAQPSVGAAGGAGTTKTINSDHSERPERLDIVDVVGVGTRRVPPADDEVLPSPGSLAPEELSPELLVEEKSSEKSFFGIQGFFFDATQFSKQPSVAAPTTTQPSVNRCGDLSHNSTGAAISPTDVVGECGDPFGLPAIPISLQELIPASQERPTLIPASQERSRLPAEGDPPLTSDSMICPPAGRSASAAISPHKSVGHKIETRQELCPRLLCCPRTDCGFAHCPAEKSWTVFSSSSSSGTMKTLKRYLCPKKGCQILDCPGAHSKVELASNVANYR